jgi:hypothetical protein
LISICIAWSCVLRAPAWWNSARWSGSLAVVELLDDLRELIWDHYGPQLLDEIRDDRQPRPSNQSGSPLDDPPF